MRIAVLTWESLHSVAVGGVAAHTSELSKALTEEGHEVHLFTRHMTDQHAHDLIDGVHYHRCAYPLHHDFVEDVNNMCRAIVDRFMIVEDLVGHFDIVHAHDWLCANAMIWIKQGRGHKSVLTIHSTEFGRCGNVFYNGQSVRIREQERAGTYWADKIITVSQTTKDEIAWMYEVPESKIHVINNGVNAERFAFNMDPGHEKRNFAIGPLDPTVLFCGRLVWQKGADILIEAIPEILSNTPSAKFIFAGDGYQRGALEARARQLGVAHAVRFVGYSNGLTLTKLFKLCEVVCVPSRNEPFGIVVLEAWSAGKPVVVTETGGPKEFVEHEVNGLKIYPRVDSVAWGINRIFSNFDRARWMGENGRKELQKRFTWEKISGQNIDVYRQLCPKVPKKTTKSVNALVFKRQDPLTEIIESTGAKKNKNGSVQLEATLMISDNSISEENCIMLESLRLFFKSQGIRTEKRDHCLKIRGNWEQVADVLEQARNQLVSCNDKAIDEDIDEEANYVARKQKSPAELADLRSR